MNKIPKYTSTILTCLGGVGVIATSILAVKATPKALKLVEEAKKDKDEELTTLEVVKIAGPAYIPTAVTGVATIACIFGANVLNKRQQASLMSAYALIDNSYKKYKNKVAELHGAEEEAKVVEELAKDDYEENFTEVEEGEQLFYDGRTGEYFHSKVEKATLDDGLEVYVIEYPYAGYGYMY